MRQVPSHNIPSTDRAERESAGGGETVIIRTKIRGMGRLWRMVFVLAVCFGASLALKIWLDRRLHAVHSSP